MRTLTLTREFSNKYYTLGKLKADTSSTPMCFTLERGWNDNKRNISSIPSGEYIVRLHDSPRFGRVPKVFDADGVREVQGRANILFHRGNWVNWLDESGIILNNTDGCILPVSNIVGQTDTGIFGGKSVVRETALIQWIEENSDDRGEVRLIVRYEWEKDTIKDSSCEKCAEAIKALESALAALKGGSR